jgi:transposase
MISTVHALGHFPFMIVQGRVTAAVFKDFFKRLIASMHRKVFLIVDGHPIHKAKRVLRFVAANNRIELCFLPPYAPELNSDDPLWANVKPGITRVTAPTKQALQAPARPATTTQRRSRVLSYPPHALTQEYSALLP